VLVGSGRVFPGMEWDTFDAERERLLGGDLFEFEVYLCQHSIIGMPACFMRLKTHDAWMGMVVSNARAAAANTVGYRVCSSCSY
jgi:hypothetical protein